VSLRAGTGRISLPVINGRFPLFLPRRHARASGLLTMVKLTVFILYKKKEG
jgi:hypothetical protein